jgi:hypothetical protein
MKKAGILGYCLLSMIVSSCGVNATPTLINNTTQPVSTQGSGVNQNGTEAALTPSPIPSRTIVTPLTATPTQTAEPIATPFLYQEMTYPEIPGEIYLWGQPFYASLDPRYYLHLFPVVISPEGDNLPSPGRAEALVFSNYSQQVAYLHELEDKTLQLWLAGLDMQELTLLWTDTTGIFRDRYIYYDYRMQWGPNDGSIFLAIPQENSGKIEFTRVVYTLSDQITTTLSDACTAIGKSPQTNQMAVWCPIENQGISSYVVIETNGTQWVSDALPTQRRITALDWTFSPDADRILYATEQGTLAIVDSSGSILQLPVTATGYSEGFFRRQLKWSRDGERVLVYGYGAGLAQCSLEAEIPCWLVFNATTGELVWKDEHFSHSDATFSPDGNWVACFYAPVPNTGYYFLLHSIIHHNKVLINYDFVVFTVTWVERNK